MKASFLHFLGEVEHIFYTDDTECLLDSHAPNRLIFKILFFFGQRHYIFCSSPISDYSFILRPNFKSQVCSSWVFPVCCRCRYYYGRMSQEKQLRCGQRQGRRWVTCLHSCMWLPITCALEPPHPLTHSKIVTSNYLLAFCIISPFSAQSFFLQLLTNFFLRVKFPEEVIYTQSLLIHFSFCVGGTYSNQTLCP